MPRTNVIFQRTTAKSQRFMISLGVAPRAAHRDYDRDCKTDGGDPYCSFDIATRAIQLMFRSGANEEDIELPSFEYSHVPSARSIVREHIERLEAWVVPVVNVAPAASQAAQVLLYGMCSGELVFIPKARAKELARIWRALHTATTWGEFRRLAGRAAYDDLVERLLDNEERRPRLADECDFNDVGPVIDCEFPGLVQQEMFSWVPGDIVTKFGQLGASALNGEMLGFDPGDEDRVVATFAAAGFTCVKDQHAIDLATGDD
jgi:hypothetical protein